MKIFVKITGKHLCQSLFLVSIFLWIFQNFKNTFFAKHLLATASVMNRQYKNRLNILWEWHLSESRFLLASRNTDSVFEIKYLKLWLVLLCFSTFKYFFVTVKNSLNKKICKPKNFEGDGDLFSHLTQRRLFTIL